MWVYAIYCVGAFNMCQGVYGTESNPHISFAYNTYQECVEKGQNAARSEMFEHLGRDIHWKCIDISDIKTKQDK